MTAISLFYPCLNTNSLALVAFISALNSFFLIPLVPIMLEMGCELVFPVGEGAAVGLLFAIGNFSGFIFGFFMSLIVGQGDSKWRTLGVIIFCLGFFLVGLLAIIKMSEEKNREKAEKELSDKRKSQISVLTSGSQDSNPRFSISLEENKPSEKIDNSVL